MDCGSVYVKMCEKAEEIQKLRPFEIAIMGRRANEGDWWYWHEEYVPVKERYPEGACKCYGGIIPNNSVWLPSQDQLQAMVGDSWVKVLNNFVWWIEKNYGCGVDEFVFEECKDFTSMEQLWLAFVMTKHNKIWRNEEWQPIS